MKRIIFIFMFAFAANQSFAQDAKNDTITIQTKIYCDHCDQCNSCQAHIEKDLTFTKGVKGFSFDLEKQTITVVYNPKKANPKTIRQAIANSGYDADEIKADPEAVAKLDECCHKQN